MVDVLSTSRCQTIQGQLSYYDNLTLSGLHEQSFSVFAQLITAP